MIRTKGNIRVKKYKESEHSVWDGFIKHSKNGHFMFFRDYMDYHKDRFIDHSLVFYKDRDIIAVMPCCVINNELKSHGGLTFGGIISNYDMRQSIMIECFDVLLEYAAANGIKKIEYKALPYIYHKQPSEEDLYALQLKGFELKKVEASTAINLRDPIEKTKLRKRQTKKAQKNGVVINVCKRQKEISDFMKLQNSVLMSRHGVKAVHSPSEMVLLHERFASNIMVYSAKVGDDIIAGSVIYVSGNVVHTQYLCADECARDIGALDAIIDKIMVDFSMKQWLDFGISTEKNGSHLNYGLIHQKEGFGGRTITYHTWEKAVTI